MFCFFHPASEGGEENDNGGLENPDLVAQRQRHYANRRSSGRASEEAGEAGRGRDAKGRGEGLTLGPPPPFPSTGEKAVEKPSSDQARDFSRASSPSQADGAVRCGAVG